MNRNRLHIGFFLYNDKRTSNLERYIYTRISYGGKPSSFSTGISVTKSQWNSNKTMVRTTSRDDALQINEELNQIQEDILAIFKGLKSNGDLITSKIIKDVYEGKQDIHGRIFTVLGIFDDYKNQKSLEGAKERVIAGISTARASVNRFLGNKDIPLSQVHNDFYFKYKAFMVSTENLKPGTVNAYLRTTKEVLDYAQWVCPDFTNPSDRIKFFKRTVEKKRHSQEDINLLLTANVSESLEPFLRMYQFQMKTGLAFADLSAFDPDKHLVKKMSGTWIRINRTKTGKLCEIPVDMGKEIPELAGVMDLIEYFRTRKKKRGQSGFIGVPTLVTYLRNLKSIAKELEIDEFSSHVARHTFATLCINGGWSPSATSRMIGDTIQTTERVYADLSSERIELEREEMRKYAN